MNLNDLSKPLIISKFLQLHLSGYLSPLTRVSPIAGLWYLLEHHMLVLFESIQSYINQLEFDSIIGLSVFARIWTADS